MEFLPRRIFSLHYSYLLLFLGTVVLLAATRRFVKNAAAREWIFAGTQVSALLIIVDIDCRGILFLVVPLIGIVFLFSKWIAPRSG